MRFIRIYSLSAIPGQEAALEAALDSLKQLATALEGCEAFVIGRDLAAASAYTVLEFWASAESHRASAAQIPKESFRAIMATLSGPPVMTDVLETG